MKVSVRAYAKINIFLDILGKLENGYHSLFMVMQSVDLYDRVTIEETAAGINLFCDAEGIPLDERNTAYQAAKVFFEYTKLKKGIYITIEKKIPHDAGLAGGSADAAGVLVALNKLYNTGLTTQELCRLGLKVGSDVPFCIVGGTCLVQNTGGVITSLPPLKRCRVVLVKPDMNVSTADAYAESDKVYLYHPDSIKMLDACEKSDFDAICRYSANVFEQVIEVPDRIEIKRIMRENNASVYQMSGSGPTVFGIFKGAADTRKAVKLLKEQYTRVFETFPAECGVIFED